MEHKTDQRLEEQVQGKTRSLEEEGKEEEVLEATSQGSLDRDVGVISRTAVPDALNT